MPNLYRDTAEPGPSTYPLEADLNADVAVVGAGFTGLSAALHLAEGGAAVAVLEAEEPGFGASGRNGGQVNPGLKADPDVVEADHGVELGRRMNAFAGGAPQFLFDLIARTGIACEARRNGTLRAAVTPRQAERLRVTAAQLERRGAPVELLDAAAAARATGTDRYLGALRDARGGDLQPLAYARGLARAALAAGARIHCGTRATALEAVPSGWRVRTACGSVRCGHVLIATNGYTDGLLPGLARSVVPVFGAIAATEPLAAALAATVMPSRSVLYESGAVTVYYRVDQAGRLLLGGRGPQREIEDARPIAYLLRYARRLWPQLAGVRFTHAWGGRLAMTADHYPHVHEPEPGLHVALGYNGRGVALATRVGAALAARILEPGLPFDLPITPVRPIRLHAAWPLAVRAAILRGRLRDRLGL